MNGDRTAVKQPNVPYLSSSPSQPPSESQLAHHDFHPVGLPSQRPHHPHRQQYETEQQYKFKRRSLSRDSIFSNSNMNANNVNNGIGNNLNNSSSNTNWRFSRKRNSFQDLLSLQHLRNGVEGSSGSGGSSVVAPSTKIVRGNGSGSFGLRRRYSFESFELKKGSSSGSESGSWQDSGRGGQHHQYPTLPLLAKRLSCRVLPTTTTLEPIPPSPTAPEDEEENSHKDASNPSGITNNDSSPDRGSSPCGNKKEEKLPPEGQQQQFESNDCVADYESSSNNPMDVIASNVADTLDTVTSSPGETINFLLDELFYEFVLLFNCIRRGCGLLMSTALFWYRTYYCTGGNDGDKNEEVQSQQPSSVVSPTNPEKGTEYPPSLSKVSSFPSLIISYVSLLISSITTATSPFFNTFCKGLHRISSSTSTLGFLQFRNDFRLFTNITDKLWRQKNNEAPNELLEKGSNDGLQNSKQDGKDQMTNYAEDTANDVDDETNRKMSDSSIRQIQIENPTRSRSTTSKLSFLREKLTRIHTVFERWAKADLFVAFCFLSLIALFSLLLTMALIPSPPSPPSSTKWVKKSPSEALDNVRGVRNAVTVMTMLMPNKEIIETTTHSLKLCSMHDKIIVNKNDALRKAEFCQAYSFASRSSLLPTSKDLSCSELLLLEYKESDDNHLGEDCTTALKEKDKKRRNPCPQRSSSVCLHYNVNKNSATAADDDDEDGGSSASHVKKATTTVDEPQGKDEKQRKQVGSGIGKEEEVQSQTQLEERQQQQQWQERKNVVLKEPKFVSQAQLDLASQEQAVWFVLSVLFTILSSSCVLTLFLVYLHKYHNNCSSQSILVDSPKSNSHYRHPRYRNLYQCGCHQSTEHSQSVSLPCSLAEQCIPRPSALPLNNCGWYNQSGISVNGDRSKEPVQGYHDAPIETSPLPTWNDPRREKVSQSCCGGTPSKRVNLAGCQCQQQPTSEEPIRSVQDQYCHHHQHHPPRPQRQSKPKGEEELQKETFCSFPRFSRESGCDTDVAGLEEKDTLGNDKKRNFVSDEKRNRNARRINSSSTCFSRHCGYYCCCYSCSGSKTCSNSNNTYDDHVDDVRGGHSRVTQVEKLRNRKGDDDTFYDDYDKWKSASGIGGDVSTGLAGYCYDGTVICPGGNTKSGAVGGGLLTFASKSVSQVGKASCTCYRCLGKHSHDEDDKNVKGDGKGKQEQQRLYSHEQQRPKTHYYNGPHYHQVDSTVTLLSKEKDPSHSSSSPSSSSTTSRTTTSSSVNCPSPCNYNHYCCPNLYGQPDEQQTKQQQQQKPEQHQPNLHQNKYFLNKFCQPDKVLFPIFWTALVVDFNFPNCSPLVHALVLGVAIKVINLYHHYCYFSRFWRGVDRPAHQPRNTAIETSEKDKEKCEFFNGKHYQHQYEQSLFDDSAHDTDHQKRTKEADGKEREPVVARNRSGVVTTRDCYHCHHQHQLPPTSFSQRFPLEAERYRSSADSLQDTHVSSRNSLEQQRQQQQGTKEKQVNFLRREFQSASSSPPQPTLERKQSNQHHRHFLLLFNPHKHNLLGCSSKITISLWLYFILIRRLGSWLFVSTTASTYTQHYFPTFLSFPTLPKLSLCFTHFLGIVGLLCAQLCVQRLSCRLNWNFYFRCSDYINFSPYHNSDCFCCDSCSFRGSSPNTRRGGGSLNLHQHHHPGHSSEHCNKLQARNGNESNERLQCTCDFNLVSASSPPSNSVCSSTNSFVVIQSSSSSASTQAQYQTQQQQQQQRDCPFFLNEDFNSAVGKSEVLSKENKETRRVSSSTIVSSSSSLVKASVCLAAEESVKAKDDQCVCTSSLSFSKANNKVNPSNKGFRNGFEYRERTYDNDNLSTKNKTECCCCCSYYYCCCCRRSNKGTLIIGNSFGTNEPGAHSKIANGNSGFQEKSGRDVREEGHVWRSNIPPIPTSSIAFSVSAAATCFAANNGSSGSNNHRLHQKTDRSSLLLHPRRINSCDSIVAPNSAQRDGSSSKRIAFLLHNDSHNEGVCSRSGGTGTSSKASNLRNSQRPNNPGSGSNNNSSCTTTGLIESIGGNTKKKKCLQFVRIEAGQGNEESRKEANKSCNKSPGPLSLSSSLLCADAKNDHTTAVQRGSNIPKVGEQKVGVAEGGLSAATTLVAGSCRRKINGTTSRSPEAAASTSRSNSSSDDDGDDGSESTQLGSNSRSSSSGSLVLVAEELPEDFKNKAEGAPLTTVTQQIEEEVETNDDNNNNNHNHNSNDDESAGNRRISESSSSNDSGTGGVSRAQEETAKPEVISTSYSASSPSESSTSSTSSPSSPNPSTSAELESSHTTPSSNPGGGTPREGPIVFHPGNGRQSNDSDVTVATVEDEDLSYFLYYNHVNSCNKNSDDNQTEKPNNDVVLATGTCRETDGSSDSGRQSMRTNLVVRSGKCEDETSQKGDDGRESCEGDGAKTVPLSSPPAQLSVSKTESPVSGLQKTNHMNYKGFSKKSAGSSGSGSSSSSKVINNEVVSTSATIITAGGRKGSVGSINRVPTPPPSLTSPHTSILAGFGGGSGRERKTYISQKFITTTGVIGSGGGSSSGCATSSITISDSGSNQFEGSRDGGGGNVVEPTDNPTLEVLSQSEPLSSSIATSIATITIFPKNDTTSSTSLTPSSSSVSAITGNTVIVDGGDNIYDDGDNSSNTSPPSSQLPPPSSSSLQVIQPSSSSSAAAASLSSSNNNNNNSTNTVSSTKRLFRSGSQCFVNSSTSSSPILHFQQSSTPPQQLLSNHSQLVASLHHQQQQQQQNSGNQQGSIENYLSTKMRRTSLPAALPVQRTAIHHGSAGVDTALLYEAHGLVTEMLLDQATLPANVVAGLKALANLLKPMPTSTIHYPSTRPKPVPLTLSIDPDYTSDFDEIPYTGEKIPTMAKGKKGVSASILRRMSTSTWTTTTSATGMPTLEPQPHTRRRRSASFRSSAMGASQRRFSQNELSSTASQHLEHGQRKTLCSLHPLSPSDLTHLSALAASTGLSQSGDNAIKSASASVSAAGSNRSSPASTPIPSPIPSPVPSRDPSPCNHRNSGGRQRDSLTTQQDLLGGSAEYIGPTTSSSSNNSNGGVILIPQPSQSTGNLLSLNNNTLSGPVVVGGNGGLIEGDSLGLLSGKNPDEDNCSTTSTLGDGPGPPDNSSGNSNSMRLSPVTFTLQEPPDINEPYFGTDDEGRDEVILTSDGTRFDLHSIAMDPLLCRLHEWDYPIFDLQRSSQTQILSHMCYKVFLETGLFETFRIPMQEFITYFHTLEMGYRDKPYHNRMHAGDVLHGVYYLTSQAIPGFQMVPADPETPSASDISGQRAWFNVEEASYGIMGANFTSLELMALYVAAAMHDYDHPGRTNAFLVSTHAKEAILYNDRSVLENHHAAAAWSLLLSNDDCNFLKYLDKAEFKRFRYLVIEAILATDLKRHFEIVAEFNTKVNEEDSPGIDWSQEDDRLLVMEIAIKLADINGPCKVHDIHVQWTFRIAEEFYEQGDEESELGLPISPFMDREHPQLARLQESFINHLVAPLCKACAEAGILPGYWIDDQDEEDDGDNGDNGGTNTGDDGIEQDVTTADDLSIATTSYQETDNEENDESSYSDDNPTNFCSRVSAGFVGGGSTCRRRIFCLQTKHLQDNHRHWMGVIKEESKKKEEVTAVKTESVAISTEDPMETIEEENNTPHSLNRSFSFEKEDSKL